MLTRTQAGSRVRPEPIILDVSPADIDATRPVHVQPQPAADNLPKQQSDLANRRRAIAPILSERF